MPWEEVTSPKMFRAVSMRLFSKTGWITLLKWLSTFLMHQGTAKIFVPQEEIATLVDPPMVIKYKIKWLNLLAERSTSLQLRLMNLVIL
jgi:hypothetical protein